MLAFRLRGIALLLSAGVMAVGVFLPWVRVTAPTAAVNSSLYDPFSNGPSTVGGFVLAGALVVAGIALADVGVWLWRWRTWRGLTCSAILGVSLVGVLSQTRQLVPGGVLDSGVIPPLIARAGGFWVEVGAIGIGLLACLLCGIAQGDELPLTPKTDTNGE